MIFMGTEVPAYIMQSLSGLDLKWATSYVASSVVTASRMKAMSDINWHRHFKEAIAQN